MSETLGFGATLVTPVVAPDARARHLHSAPQDSFNRGSFHFALAPCPHPLWEGLLWRSSHWARFSLGARRTQGKDQTNPCSRKTPSAKRICHREPLNSSPHRLRLACPEISGRFRAPS